MTWLSANLFYLAAAGAEAMPAGTILSFDKEFLIKTGIQFFNVLLLTVFLVFLLYKPVKKFLDDRTERIKHEIDAVQRETQEVEELREKYEKMIANIEKEREEILRQAHKKAVEKSDQLLFAARHEAEQIYSRALAELEEERESIREEMKRQMVELSVLIAGRFVEVSIDKETQDRYIEQALSEWEEG